MESPDETPYDGKPFNLIALILKFEFIGTNYRLLTSRDTGILITFISSANPIFAQQKEAFFEYLGQEQLTYFYNAEVPDIIEITAIPRARTKFISENFDIVRMITSTRALKVRPGEYGAIRREFGFTVTVPENLTTVGIIDSGINKIEPLQNVITDLFYDHTAKGAFWDEAGHGTMVAGLVVLGDEFQQTIKGDYTAKAKLVAIKALHFTDDNINIPQLLNDIKDAKRNHGVRLFNMSLNIPTAKKYNDTYCQFAYELDKLAYEEDIFNFYLSW